MHVHVAHGDDHDLSDKVLMRYSTMFLCSSICLLREGGSSTHRLQGVKLDMRSCSMKNICYKATGIVLESLHYWNSRTLKKLDGKSESKD